MLSYIYTAIGSVLAFSTHDRGFKLGRSRHIFWGEEILTTPSFRGEVKPSVPCRRFAVCKRSLNLGVSRNLGKLTGKISRPEFHLSLLGYLASLRTYRHLAAKVERLKTGESNGKLLHRTCPGCSGPEPYRSHEWSLVPANPASKG